MKISSDTTLDSIDFPCMEKKPEIISSFVFQRKKYLEWHERK